MDVRKEQQQRESFRSVLFDLAKSQTLLGNPTERSQIYKRLENIYYSTENSEEFRHFYSDIFSVLIQIQQDDNLGNIDILGQNIYEIRKGYQAKNQDADGKAIDISDSIRKLYDHVNLDIARINYMYAADRKLIDEDKFKEIRAKVNGYQSDIEVIKKEAKNIQKEYITILGIFAAVVLTFTGGIAYSTSVLEYMHQSSIYRIVLVALIIGFVLVNILFGLFYYIDGFVHQKSERKIEPMLIVNGIIILLMTINVIAWSNGSVEKRNNQIKKPENKTISLYVNVSDS